MFYSDDPENSLRFGDVLTWGVLAAPYVEYNSSNPNEKDFKLDINFPNFSVVLTPCCSIDNKNIVLTPLIEILGSFHDNPYFEADLTNINRKMEAEDTVSPSIWEKFPDEQKQKRLEEGKQYGLLEFFIYEKNDILPEYKVNRRNGDDLKTNYYMIDFRNSYKLNSRNFMASESMLLRSKILQLNPKTREELRKKIGNYYRRIPDEDKCFL